MMLPLCRWRIVTVGRALIAAIVGVLLAAGNTAAQSPATADLRQAVCRIVDQSAAENRLPPAFLARILWQESRFRGDAASPAGAQGVAQFMPQTAVERGLADPYDAGPAIAAAARLLADLAGHFGNLGLAAAAYDAGAARVDNWLRAQTSLPTETRLYVAAVTGSPAEDWARHPAGLPMPALAGQSCLSLTAGRMRLPPTVLASATPPRPADTSPVGRALSRIATLLSDLPQRQQSLRDAESLCGKLRALGARCGVYSP
jgi:hypothetical protein